MTAKDPFVTFNPKVELVRSNSNCNFEDVTINMVRMVGDNPELKKYLEADEDERNSLLTRNGKILQHLLVLNVPACDSLNPNNNNYRHAEIQEGTHFNCISKKGYQFITMYGQEIDETSSYSKKLKDRFERTMVPKYVPEPSEEEYSSSVFKSLTENMLLKLNTDKKKFFSFKITFEKDFELPDPQSWLMIFQCHQAGGDAPPLGMRVKPSANPMGDIYLEFSIRQSRDEVENSSKNIELVGKVINSSTGEREGLLVKRGVEYQFKFELKPSTVEKDGELQKPSPLKIWVNEAGKGDELIYNKKVHWGYPMFFKKGNLNEDSDRMSIKVGLYRRRHPRTHAVRIGVAKYGPTFESVV